MTAAAPTRSTPELPDLLSPKQLAEKLRCSERLLEVWRSKGQGPRWIRMGQRLIRYRAEDVAAWRRALLADPSTPCHWIERYAFVKASHIDPQQIGRVSK